MPEIRSIYQSELSISSFREKGVTIGPPAAVSIILQIIQTRGRTTELRGPWTNRSLFYQDKERLRSAEYKQAIVWNEAISGSVGDKSAA